MVSEKPRLVRVREGRVVGGVATGVARYLNVDVVLVRLALAALTFADGLGVLVYLVMWVIVPDEEMVNSEPRDSLRANMDDISQQARQAGEQIGNTLRNVTGGNRQSQVLIGVGLMVLGILFAVRQLGFHLGFNLFPSRLLAPLLLIGIGVAILNRRDRGE